MKDYISIGSSPCDEDCVQLGSSDYYKRATKECNQFIKLIRKACGEEPEESTARLAIKHNSHDFGTYLDVVCYFDDQDELGAEYALWCEGNTPMTWDAEEGSAKFVKAFSQTQVKEILKKAYNQKEEGAQDMIDCLMTDVHGFYKAPRFTTEEQVNTFIDKRLAEM